MLHFFEYDLKSSSVEYNAHSAHSLSDNDCVQSEGALIEHYHLKAQPAQSVFGLVQQRRSPIELCNHGSLLIECPYCHHSQRTNFNRWYALLDTYERSLRNCKIDAAEWLMARYLGLSSAGAGIKPIKISEAELSEIKEASGCALYRCNNCENVFAVSFELKENRWGAEEVFLDESIFGEFDITVRKTCFDSFISFSVAKSLSPLWTYHFHEDGSTLLNGKPIGPTVIASQDRELYKWKGIGCIIPRIKCESLVNALTKIDQGPVLRNYLDQIKACLGHCDTQHAIMLLSYVNRYRNYPKSFYQEGFRISAEEPYIELRYDESLPTNALALDNILKASSLPRKKSVRKILFQDPWLISLVQKWEKPPFENLDILTDLLRTKTALSWLKEYTLSQNESSKKGRIILDYMKKKHGEAPVWHHLKSLGFEESPFEYIGLEKSLCYLGINPLESIDAEQYTKNLSLKEEFDLLMSLSHHYDLYPWSIADYEYQKVIEGLQYFGSGISIELPRSPFEIHYAGILLSNCLGSYAEMIPLLTTIFLIKKHGEIVGAIELDFEERSILQAFEPKNKPLESMPSVWSVVQDWAKENILYGLE